jgi:hypothetical protein
MPTTGEAISELYERFLDIGTPTSDEVAVRDWILGLLKRASNRVWTIMASRGAPWTRTDGEMTITALDEGGELPANFMFRSAHMRVSFQGQTGELDYRSPGIVHRLLATSPNPGVPKFYTLDGSTINRRPQLFAWPRPAVNTFLDIRSYVRSPPVLVDEGQIETPDGEGDTLKDIPEIYHEAVLFEWVQKRLMRDEGDDRDPLQDREFREALAEVAANEISVAPRRGPRYGSGRRYP